MAYVFRGGIYFGINSDKINDAKIERIAPPRRLRVPLTGNESEPDTVVVSVGAHVLRGDVIAVPTSSHSSVTHAPVSGRVVSLGDAVSYDGKRCRYIEIENDMQYAVSPAAVGCTKKLSECESDEIVEMIHRTGIIDTDSGALVSKLILRARGRAEFAIVNAVFDDPSVLSDKRLAFENPAAVINGFKIILKALGLRRGIIAVGETDRPLLKKLTELTRHDKLISINIVRSKYPAGGVRELIYAVTGREMPEGRIPVDLGCVTFGAVTAANIFSSFVTGMPYVSRVVTVSGNAVKNPKNIMAPIGTPIRELIDLAGGLASDDVKIVVGGNMRGVMAENFDFSVTKMMSAVIVSRKKANDEDKMSACIRCGRCMSVCPMRLVPTRLYTLIERGKYEKAEQLGANLCDGCGCCSFICPAKLPLSDKIYNFGARSDKTNAENSEE